MPSTNHIKIGGSAKLSLSKGNITVGVKGTTDYGPTSNSGFYSGIVPTAGGYVIYINPTGTELRAHAPKNDAECMYYLKKYGAPDGTIDDMLTWALTQNTILVLKGELTNSISNASWQNVAGSDSTTGFFFGGFRTDGLLDLVKVGWLANGTGVTNAPVTAIDRNNQTITISGSQFVSGQFYIFSLNTDPGLTIATNAGGGLDGFNVGGQAVAMAILANPAIGTTYPIGSLITFQNGEVRTLTGIDDYGAQYDVFYSSPISSGTLFPITIR